MISWTEALPTQEATTVRVHDGSVELQQEEGDEVVTVRIAVSLWPMLRARVDELVAGKKTQ